MEEDKDEERMKAKDRKEIKNLKADEHMKKQRKLHCKTIAGNIVRKKNGKRVNKKRRVNKRTQKSKE